MWTLGGSSRCMFQLFSYVLLYLFGLLAVALASTKTQKLQGLRRLRLFAKSC